MAGTNTSRKDKRARANQFKYLKGKHTSGFWRKEDKEVSYIYAYDTKVAYEQRFIFSGEVLNKPESNFSVSAGPIAREAILFALLMNEVYNEFSETKPLDFHVERINTIYQHNKPLWEAFADCALRSKDILPALSDSLLEAFKKASSDCEELLDDIKAFKEAAVQQKVELAGLEYFLSSSHQEEKNREDAAYAKIKEVANLCLTKELTEPSEKENSN